MSNKVMIGIVVGFVAVVVGLPVVMQVVRGGGNSPEGVTRAFLKASNAGDTEDVKELFTEKARAQMASNGMEEYIGAGDEGPGEYTIGKATITGDKAEVPVTMKSESHDDFAMLTRKEKGNWRIYGLKAGDEDFSLTINFENPAGGLLGGLGEALEGAFEDAFQQMGQQMQGGMSPGGPRGFGQGMPPMGRR